MKLHSTANSEELKNAESKNKGLVPLYR